MKRYLLCTDLDRTLIPNGMQPESPAARERLKRLVSRNDMTLAYVTGRHRALIEQAIAEFDLAQPDFVIADVGTTIYRTGAAGWERWEAWDAQVAQDWQGLTLNDLFRLLSVFPALRQQETEKQAFHKLSFYIVPGTDVQQLLSDMDAQLKYHDVRANLIWSIDEKAGNGLLDVLPSNASKLHAIRYLMQQHGFDNDSVVFAGDSGNDLDVLGSDIPSVLVANADDELKVITSVANSDAFYIAKGDYLGMNGNYSAGILEGAAHYWPAVDKWLREMS